MACCSDVKLLSHCLAFARCVSLGLVAALVIKHDLLIMLPDVGCSLTLITILRLLHYKWLFS